MPEISLGQAFGYNFGSQALGSTYNGLIGMANQALQNKYNREMAEMQNQFNLDMWNKQNEYNTPTAQMQRLVDAGLSPNLAYGSVSSGVASKAPEQVVPQQNAGLDNFISPNLGNAFNTAFSIYSGLQNIELQQANINYINAKTEDIYDKINSFGQLMNTVTHSDSYRPFGRGTEDGFTGGARGRAMIQYQSLMNDIEKGLLMQKQRFNVEEKTDYQKKLNQWYDQLQEFGMFTKGFQNILQLLTLFQKF